MAGEGPIGTNLRKVGNINSKAKDVRDTDMLEPGAEKRTAAEKDSNKGEQYHNKGGTAGSQWGGRNTNS